MKTYPRFVLLAAALFGLVQVTVAQNWTASLLNDLAVRDGNGAIIVLGTEGSYGDNPLLTKESVFDGDVTTFFDPPSTAVSNAPCWAGVELNTPMMLTRVRYAGRSGSGGRMNGCLIQGANQSDFSDAVTLLVARTTTGRDFNNEVVATTNTFQAFSFFRILGPNLYPAYSEGICAGNAAEVEFYGKELPSDPNLPTKPAAIFADVVNGHANIKINITSDAIYYEIERRQADEPEWHRVDEIYFREAGASLWRDPLPARNALQYRVRAGNVNGVSEWVIFSMTPRLAASGTWIGSQGTYGNNMTGDKVFDGNIDTFFDGPSSSSGSGLWTGLDLGKTMTVAAVAYLPRLDGNNNARMNGGWFEAADTIDFFNPTTIYTITAAPVRESVTVATLATPVTARYFRYCSPNGGWGNASEIEFILDQCNPPSPTGLSVSHGDMTNDFPTLRWSMPDVASSGLVYRATSPGGPYVNLTPDGLSAFQSTFTDTTLTAGVLYWYRVVSLVGDYESPPSDHVTYRRLQRLERDWSDLTQVKPGVTVYCDGTPYNGNTSWGAAKAFDNDLDTYADIIPAGARLGVEFGEPCSIGYIRLVPRNSSGFTNRVNNSVLYGWNQPDEPVPLATVSNVILKTYTRHDVSDTTPYRISYLTKLSGEFFANLAELEFYGWPAANLDGVLSAPALVDTAIQSTGVELIWSDGLNVAAYRVERRPVDNSSGWEVVGTTTGNTLIDTEPVIDQRVTYRVVAVSDTEESFSDEYPLVAYATGSGSGLAAQYSVGFNKNYDTPEKLRVAYTGVDPVVDFDWSGGPLVEGETESDKNVRVLWCGTLIVPRNDLYTFRLQADDGVRITLDDEIIVNRWQADSKAITFSRRLEEGEYSIRVDYYQDDGSAGIRLEWDAPGYFEVIPATQLHAGAIPDDTIAPWQGHTFNASYLGLHELDSMSGAITVKAYGGDLHGTNNCGHILWQPVTHSSFRIDARVDQSVNSSFPTTKAYLIVKAGESGDAPLIAVARAVLPIRGGNMGVKARLAYGDAIADQLTPEWINNATNPVWLRLQREGSTFSCLYRSEGSTEWETLYTVEDSEGVFGKRVYAGFGVSSPTVAGIPGVLQSATFSQINIRPISGLVLMVK